MGQNTYAFPTDSEARSVDSGMTLRDYFAARAMQSLVITHTESGIPIIAGMAYLMADKMMEVRDDTNS
jgi:hypothetical protein